MLPSVSPLTSSPKKRLQFTGRRRSHKRVRPTWSRGPHSLHLGPGRLPDADEHSVDRVVDAERLLHHVAVLVETDRKAEQRGLLRDLRLLDLRPDLGTARRPEVRAQIKKTKISQKTSLLGLPISFDKNGDMVKKPFGIYHSVNGVFVRVG